MMLVADEENRWVMVTKIWGRRQTGNPDMAALVGLIRGLQGAGGSKRAPVSLNGVIDWPGGLMRSQLCVPASNLGLDNVKSSKQKTG